MDDNASPGSTGTGADSPAQAQRQRRRRVATPRAGLTAEQLAKRRENDREAQRNTRRRTKTQIEALQQRIDELTAQDAYRDYLAMKQAKEAAERECAEMRRRLGGIIAELQGIIGGGTQTLTDAAGDNCAPANTLTPGSMASPGPRSVEASQAAGSPRPGTAASLDAMAPEDRLRLGFVLHPSQERDTTTTTASAGDQSPAHATPVLNCAATCPLDSLLLDAVRERRAQWTSGTPPAVVLGPRYPSISALLDPSAAPHSHPLSRVLTDILPTFPDISALPERVAVLYVMFLLLRWQVSRARDDYARLPGWMRPTPAQREVAHPAWIDYLPFPAMRERLARSYVPGPGPGPGMGPTPAHRFVDFFVPFTTTIRLGWPYPDADALLQSADGLAINPVFESHLRNHDNWSLGDAFARAFPSLEGTYKIDQPGQS